MLSHIRRTSNPRNPRRAIALPALAILLAAAFLLAGGLGAPGAPGNPGAGPPPVSAQAGTIDYDADDDRFIDISTPAQLQALQRDSNGDGITPATDYDDAFPMRDDAGSDAMGCPSTCQGYELVNDLDMTGFEFTSIGGISSGLNQTAPFGSQFHGRGYIIRNLTIDNSRTSTHTGLFGRTNGATITGVGLVNVDIRFTATGGVATGGLVAQDTGNTTIRYSYVNGGMIQSPNISGQVRLGGLVGSLSSSGTIAASYANVGTASGTGGNFRFQGSLVGRMYGGNILASYAAGSVIFPGGSTSSTDTNIGGLVGRLHSGGTVTASYSTATVISRTGSRVGGFIGHRAGTVTNSYWDNEVSGPTTGGAGVAASASQSTSDLQTPTDYGTTANNDIYAAWNINVDGVAGNDDPWNFGDATSYPAIRFQFDAATGDNAGVDAREEYAKNLQIPNDYDTDDNDLIEVDSLAKLDAIRADRDGNGLTLGLGHSSGFPNPQIGMGCPGGSCDGYELTADLDFDTNGDGAVNGSDLFSGSWTPISSYSGEFQGHGHTLSNLRITAGALTRAGLFGVLTDGALVENLGLLNVNIDTIYPHQSGSVYIGALAGGSRRSVIRSVYATGRVRGYYDSTGSARAGLYFAGGLLGELEPGTTSQPSSVITSWANVRVSTDNRTSTNNTPDRAGGLIGFIAAAGSSQTASAVLASYAMGEVTVRRDLGHATERCRVGGFVGQAAVSTIIASYSIGNPYCPNTTSAAIQRGGFIGHADNAAGSTFTNNYWDSDHSGISTGTTGATPQTNSALVTPTAYGTQSTDIYMNWDIDLDDADTDNDYATGGDDPWDFVNAANYPILRYEYGADADATAREARARALQIPMGYDSDNDDLIEIRTLAQLNAIRWDRDGNGAVVGGNRGSYEAAFPRAAAGMGCNSGYGMCDGYELAADLDFDTNDDGTVDGDDAYANWAPLSGDTWATAYTGAFHGNGYTISNLTIASSAHYVGLFGSLDQARVEQVGLLNVDIAVTRGENGWISAGALAAASRQSTIHSVYATGRLTASNGPGNAQLRAGGLLGALDAGAAGFPSQIVASWSAVNLTTRNTAVISVADRAGGLVGQIVTGTPAPSIIASYSTGSVSVTTTAGSGARCRSGGLVGQMAASTIIASYSVGAPDCAVASGSTAQTGALIGWRSSTNTTVTNAYWDTGTVGALTAGVGDGADTGVTGQTATALQTPTAYGSATTTPPSIYAAWNVNTDGDTSTGTPTVGGDDPWDFVDADTYPILRYEYGSDAAATARAARARAIQIPAGYDSDGDDLIEIRNLDQLNAIRYDLDGTGFANAVNRADYLFVFPNARHDLGCASGHGMCAGYELMQDLDFDTNGDGTVDSSDAYPSWTPIGGVSNLANTYTATFQGNGHTISNLTITTPAYLSALFTALGDGARVEQLGLLNVKFEFTKPTSGNASWTLAAPLAVHSTQSTIISTYATGRINVAAGPGNSVLAVGGLVGTLRAGSAANPSQIIASWSSVAITTTSPTVTTSGNTPDRVGGLVGDVETGANAPAIIASYATGDIDSTSTGTAGVLRCIAGGLVGRLAAASVIASYSTGTPTCNVTTANGSTGGLRGAVVGAPTITDSYWDATTTGISTAGTATLGYPQTAAALRAPTAYNGIYADWNVNVDGTDGNDDPWDFGANGQYPILKFGYNDFARQMQRSAYDLDGDGLLEVNALPQLDAVRLDLAGAGDTRTMTAADRTAYQTAFPGHIRCAPNDCIGYELTANLDFAGSQWAAAPGWTPIGVDTAGAATPYTGDFNGNHHTISNLLIELTTATTDGGSFVGLFGDVNGSISNVGLVNPNITNTRTGAGAARTGALAGRLAGGGVRGSYVSGGTVSVSQNADTNFQAVYAGCLLGFSNALVTESYASCPVSGANTDADTGMHVGGLVGSGVNITRSYATGTVTGSGAGSLNLGGLVGLVWTNGDIISSYATGAVTSTGTGPGNAGGLAGAGISTTISASYATGAVSVTDNPDAGGLIGNVSLATTDFIAASYATGNVERTGATATGSDVGGLIGFVNAAGSTTPVTATYAVGTVSNANGNVGGLVGAVDSGNTTVVEYSYWNSDAAGTGTGQANSAGCSTTDCSAKTTTELQGATAYGATASDIYFTTGWNLNLDGVVGADDPWHFGTATDYPILTYGHDLRSLRAQRPLAVTTDYDLDDDNLIDLGGGGVGNLAALHQLNALRLDAAGTGETGLRGGSLTAYLTAFPATMVGMGCPATCQGYELAANLDFDDTGDGMVDSSDAYDSWIPLPAYNAAFAGDGYIISRLTINDTALDNAGLFGATGPDAVITGVGLDAVSINGQHYVGALAGTLRGTASASWSAGAVAGDHTVGGLVGRVGRPTDPNGALTASYSRASVDVRAGTALVGGGGLVGSLYGTVNYSYAAGPVGVVVGTSRGLIGITESGSTVAASYWDVNNSGVADDNDADAPEGVSVDDLQAPAAYANSDYAAWNVDVDNADGDNDLTTGADDPWDFGTTLEYPVLKYGAGANAANILAQRPVDYDRDGDDLIEIRTPAQLDAVRYDLDGEGDQDSGITDSAWANYTAAFDRALPAMGCFSVACLGYELAADLDLSGYANWTPLGSYNHNSRTVTFQGNGHTISNLTITSSTSNDVGLFAGLGNRAVVESVGLLNVNIADSLTSTGSTQFRLGALAGVSDATVRYTYATGAIAPTVAGADATMERALTRAGGLLGVVANGGTVSASWADVDITAVSNSSNTASTDQIGGLVGGLWGLSSDVSVIASFAKGDVTSDRDRAHVGGLIGYALGITGPPDITVTITAAYATGQPTATDGAATAIAGGLSAGAGSQVTVNNSYWDTATAMTTSSPGGGTGYTTTQLQTPAEYTGTIYANWNVNVDGNLSTGAPTTGADDPWHFGTGTQYPTLVFNHDIGSIRLQRGETATTDYDADDDNLIDIGNDGNAAGLHQLNALRLDPNGSGEDGITGRDAATYLSAFPGLIAGMGCPDGCQGYELTAHLDFDDTGDGMVDGNDLYANWTPLAPYSAEFQGNGFTIANLTISGASGISFSSGLRVGLFGGLHNGALVEGLGLTDVNINVTGPSSGGYSVGALAGAVRGPLQSTTVRSSYAVGTITVTVTAANTVANAGGLIGMTDSTVAASWADVDVTLNSTATLTNRDGAGGLVGWIFGVTGGRDARIIASYARGAVTSNSNRVGVGGLVGTVNRAYTAITASYATGSAQATSAQAEAVDGGLVGYEYIASIISPVSNSYWEITADHPANPADDLGAGQTRADLQSTAGYSGIYANWNVNVDGQPGNDDPWDFGASDQYPVLKYGYTAAGLSAQRPVDYDADGDDLIEITTPAQLNAVRWDLDGNGQPASSAADYRAAFPNAMRFMGCTTVDTTPQACGGYELAADLDLSGYANWETLGTLSAAVGQTVTFQGNGHIIDNLRMTSSAFTANGLFGSITSTATVESVGLTNVNIALSRSSTSPLFYNTGALAGIVSGGTVRYSYAVGAVAVTVPAPAAGSSEMLQTRTGGLAGALTSGGTIAASWADVDVTVTSASTNANPDSAGGMVGLVTGSSTTLLATYAKGDVTADRDGAEVGGLAGEAAANTSVVASYSIGTPSGTGMNPVVGGLIGENAGTITNSYWDADTTGITMGSNGTSYATTALQMPTEYGSGIYTAWNVNVDGDTMTGTPTVGGDDPWHFGSATEYPILQFGYNAANISRQMGVEPTNDYDLDDDGLIDVDSLAQLNAIRYDLDGDGDTSGSATANYLAGFAGPVRGMGCPTAGCTGYELVENLYFDTNDDGAVDVDDHPLAWGDGSGWDPIGDSSSNRYNATFDGNGHTIEDLFIDRGAVDQVGIFGYTGPDSRLTRIGLPDVNVTGNNNTGALAGELRGRVSFSWVTGQVNAVGTSGMLVGTSYGTVASSWSAGRIRGLPSSAGIGGLVGVTGGPIIASYSHARVDGVQIAGGLVGQAATSGARITASYAAGRTTISSGSDRGGLFGRGLQFNSATGIVSSYYDSDTTGVTGGETTANLRGTLGYSGIYATWDDHDVDGDMANTPDSPWDFLTAAEYPILRFGHSPTSIALQRALQDAGLRTVTGTGVERIRKPTDTTYILEIPSLVTEVTLTLTPASADAAVVVDAVTHVGAPPDPDWVSGTVIPLTPDTENTEEYTIVHVIITAPNGVNAQTYRLTIQRVFCPKAEVNRPQGVVGEGGSADFTILVCGMTTEPVIVTYAVDEAASTAEPDDVGRAFTGTITVPQGNDQTATLSFPITDDDDAEPSETLTVIITGVSGGTDRIDRTPATARIALSDPTLNLRAPEGTGAGGEGAGQDTPLNAQSMLVLMEGQGNTYTMRMETNPRESITVVIHSNHASITTTPDRVTFNANNYQTPQRITINAAPDGDDKNERATLTHILTDDDGGLIEIIDQIPLFIADTDPPEDDDIC